MRAMIILAFALALAGCQTTKVEIARPCGVLDDALKDVRAKDRSGDFRIARHYERGRAAGCWG